MPSSNPVYQPTTVTYERHKEWSTNYITERVIPGCYQKPHLQRLLLAGAILLAILGLGLAIYALVNDVNTHKDESDIEPMPTFDDNSEENIEQEEVPETDANHDHETNVILGSIGICLILISLVMYVVFLKLKGMCRGFLPQHHNPRAGNLNTSGGQPVHSEASHQSAISYKGVQVNLKCQFCYSEKLYGLEMSFIISSKNLVLSILNQLLLLKKRDTL
jgi:hypothetical protein